MRRKQQQISDTEKRLVLKAFQRTITSFSGNDAVSQFADYVLTESEKIVIGRRIAIAQMILLGKTYFEVNEVLRISPNTFSKVRKWLQSELPGYESVLKEEKEKLKLKQQSTTSKKEYVDPFSLEGLKRKYPMHFLLLNIFDELRK